MRRAIPVDHGITPDFDAYGIDDQRVAFIVTHGIAVPGRGDLRRMGLVQTHAANLLIVAIKDDDLVRQLQQLRWAIRKNERNPPSPTWVTRVGRTYPMDPEVTG